MNPISLEQLTIDDAGPIELVSIASALGCSGPSRSKGATRSSSSDLQTHGRASTTTSR